MMLFIKTLILSIFVSNSAILRIFPHDCTLAVSNADSRASHEGPHVHLILLARRTFMEALEFSP